ncbi:MAG: hypothetical protein EOP39_24805, partial [Rubrivivax sp.]
MNPYSLDPRGAAARRLSSTDSDIWKLDDNGNRIGDENEDEHPPLVVEGAHASLPGPGKYSDDVFAVTGSKLPKTPEPPWDPLDASAAPVCGLVRNPDTTVQDAIDLTRAALSGARGQRGEAFESAVASMADAYKALDVPDSTQLATTTLQRAMLEVLLQRLASPMRQMLAAALARENDAMDSGTVNGVMDYAANMSQALIEVERVMKAAAPVSGPLAAMATVASESALCRLVRDPASDSRRVFALMATAFSVAPHEDADVASLLQELRMGPGCDASTGGQAPAEAAIDTLRRAMLNSLYARLGDGPARSALMSEIGKIPKAPSVENSRRMQEAIRKSIEPGAGHAIGMPTAAEVAACVHGSAFNVLVSGDLNTARQSLASLATGQSLGADADLAHSTLVTRLQGLGLSAEAASSTALAVLARDVASRRTATPQQQRWVAQLDSLLNRLTRHEQDPWIAPAVVALARAVASD